MQIALIMEKVGFLQGVLDPGTVDGNPGQPGPVFRTAISDYIVAELVQDLSHSLNDREIAPSLLKVARDLAALSAHGLVTSLDEGDDICPPWHRIPVGPPRHGPGPDPAFLYPQPSPWLSANPEPVPWLQRMTPAMNDIVLAHGLQQLASLTTNEKASAAMEHAGQTIVKGASGKLFDEYCGTIVKPR